MLRWRSASLQWRVQEVSDRDKGVPRQHVGGGETHLLPVFTATLEVPSSHLFHFPLDLGTFKTL